MPDNCILFTFCKVMKSPSHESIYANNCSCTAVNTLAACYKYFAGQVHVNVAYLSIKDSDH